MLNTKKQYQKDVIETYGGIPNCNCENCNECCDEQVEECYTIVSRSCSSKFAELINYAGYDSEEEFLDNI